MYLNASFSAPMALIVSLTDWARLIFYVFFEAGRSEHPQDLLDQGLQAHLFVKEIDFDRSRRAAILPFRS